jgi:malonyl-CoA/methylmalonyl-CoA synthetase
MTNPLYDALVGKHSASGKTLLHTEDGTTLSYAAFVELAGRFATVLARLGLSPGDRVAVQVAKTPEALALYAACLQHGAVFLPLNTGYTAVETEYFLSDSGAKLFVCSPSSEQGFAPLCDRIRVVLRSLGERRDGSLAAGLSDVPASLAVADRRDGDLAAILYTSGTTGRSKGAMLTQNNLLSNAQALVETWGVTDRDVLLHALPIYHAHGLFVATNVLLSVGGTILFHPSFNVDAAIRSLPLATLMMGVPTFYTRLLADSRLDREGVAHMRLFVSGSAPLLAETHMQFEARTGHRILERYGMTETSMITSNPLAGERRPGAVGFPLPGVLVRVADKQGSEQPQGEVGVLEVKGPNVFAGYWNQPERTAAEFRHDGYFITGDMARIDDDGYVHLVGREKISSFRAGSISIPKRSSRCSTSCPVSLSLQSSVCPTRTLARRWSQLSLPGRGWISRR